MASYATLGKNGLYSEFIFENHTIRFLAPYSLERYTEIKTWDKGYLVVMAKYKHNTEPEEEYIDLQSIMHDLGFDADVLLERISGVLLANTQC